MRRENRTGYNEKKVLRGRIREIMFFLYGIESMFLSLDPPLLFRRFSAHELVLRVSRCATKRRVISTV